MHTDIRLGWVQRNRVRKTRERRVGEVLGVLAQRPELSESGLSQFVASTIAGLVDQEFTRHCRIATSDNGIMVVNVDEAALVCPMRMRWLNALCGALSIRRRQRPLTSVVFQYGKIGVRITDLPRRQS